VRAGVLWAAAALRLLARSGSAREVGIRTDRVSRISTLPSGATCRPASSPMRSSARLRSPSRCGRRRRHPADERPPHEPPPRPNAQCADPARSEGRTLMIVEHDMSVVFGLADRIRCWSYGEIVASGTPSETATIRGSGKPIWARRRTDARRARSQRLLRQEPYSPGRRSRRRRREVVSLIGRNGVAFHHRQAIIGEVAGRLDPVQGPRDRGAPELSHCSARALAMCENRDIFSASRCGQNLTLASRMRSVPVGGGSQTCLPCFRTLASAPTPAGVLSAAKSRCSPSAAP